MAILLINNRPLYCGIGRYTFSLFQSLERLSQKVEVLTWQNRVIKEETYYNNLIEESIRGLSQILFVLKIPNKYSIYHITSPALSYGSKIFKNSIITFHDLIPFEMPRCFADQLIARIMDTSKNANRIICVSNYIKNNLPRYIDVHSKMEVIPCGIHHEIFKFRDKAKSRQRLGLDPHRPIILHVGSEEPKKNIPTLIKSFNKILKDIPDAQLIRIGRRTKVVQSLIDTLGLNNKIAYYEDVREIEYFYNASDLLIFPSCYEGFGLPPLEAMASGCPVITSNNTSLPEVVGNAGITIDPFDIDNFAYWAQQILTDEDIKDNLVKKGINRSAMFSWENCAKETLMIYNEVLNE